MVNEPNLLSGFSGFEIGIRRLEVGVPLRSAWISVCSGDVEWTFVDGIYGARTT